MYTGCAGVALKVSVIVCAHNEALYLPACLHSLLAQTRPPDEILVIDNASTDETRALAEQIPQVRVVAEPRKGLVVAREAARSAASGDILVYLDADCRAPLTWLERIERRFARAPSLVALCGPYRYYDWDRRGRLVIGTYDLTVAPLTQLLVKHVLRIGCIFYGGNFAARRDALDRVGGFDTSIDFHGEDTDIGRRLFGIGRVALCRECYLYTSARRFKTMGKAAVIRLYVRNFTSELLRHRPRDVTHVDVRG
jgi:glycosyltransferase involved in cell wall biosynthesis